jgi:hypothetical protein
MILPFLIISVSNLMIFYKLMTEAKELRERRFRHKCKLYRMTSLLNPTESSCRLEISSVFKRQKHPPESQKHHSKSNRETTKIVLIIASTFLILNFPIASIKTYSFFYQKSMSSNLDQTAEETNAGTKEVVEKMASFIYYINFSINFFLYTLKTKTFRDNFIRYFLSYFKRKL